MSTVAYSKPIPVIAAPDVLVCGAGLAGLGAAVAAARQGASVWAGCILDPDIAMHRLGEDP